MGECWCFDYYYFLIKSMLRFFFKEWVCRVSVKIFIFDTDFFLCCLYDSLISSPLGVRVLEDECMQDKVWKWDQQTAALLLRLHHRDAGSRYLLAYFCFFQLFLISPKHFKEFGSLLPIKAFCLCFFHKIIRQSRNVSFYPFVLLSFKSRSMIPLLSTLEDGVTHIFPSQIKTVI